VETQDTRTLPELVSAVTGDLADLVRKESELVRTEVSEKISQAGHAAGQASIGAALLLGAFLVLLQALVLGLSKVMDPLWASLLVGVAVAVLGFVLVMGAIAKVKPARLQPDRTTRQLQKDAQMVKEQVR
jgi:formate hydrogenlyase subunit 4